MVYSDKEQVQEGSLLPTAPLLEEAERLKSLAHRHELELSREGLTQRDLATYDKARDQAQREAQRLEDPPTKPKPLDKDMAAVVDRALRWRARLIHRAERLHTDDRPGRLKYRRGLLLHNLPDRVYEEVSLLLEIAKVDLPRFERAQLLDQAFIDAGEDLRYELMGYPKPDREAWVKYEQAKRTRRWGPPPEPPPALPKLPEVMDNAATVAAMRGLLYSYMRRIAAAGQAAFTVLEGREPRGHAAIRQEFVLRVRPAEYDATMLHILVEAEGPARRGVKQGSTAAAAPDPSPHQLAPEPQAAPEPAPARKEPAPRRLVNPGGAPPEIGDTLKPPPPGAYGLIRPSTTRGRK
ncbi:MAG: hypothetical protein ABIJ09_05210 [Pseudomonadota bacterium]